MSRREQLRAIFMDAFDPQLHPGMTAEEFADHVLAVEPAGMFGALAALADQKGRPLFSIHELGAVQRGFVQTGLG